MAKPPRAIEITEFVVATDQQRRFRAAFRDVLPILMRQPGALRVNFGSALEWAESFFLVVVWKQLADHESFRQSDEFNQFVGRFRPLLKKPSRVRHIYG
jgi:quinol monooxygenase YgiN